MIKALSFLAVGLAGAAFGLAAGGLVLSGIGALAGAVVGFVLGGIVGVLILHLGMGFVLGYFGYLAVRDLSHVFLLAAAVGLVLFFVGIVATGKLLELATALVGGIILYGVLVFFGLTPLVSFAIALALGIAGFSTQQGRRRGANWTPG